MTSVVEVVAGDDVVAVDVVDVLVCLVGRKVSVVDVAKSLEKIARRPREPNLCRPRAKRRGYHKVTLQPFFSWHGKLGRLKGYNISQITPDNHTLKFSYIH